jgi:hypothetical protein
MPGRIHYKSQNSFCGKIGRRERVEATHIDIAVINRLKISALPRRNRGAPISPSRRRRSSPGMHIKRLQSPVGHPPHSREISNIMTSRTQPASSRHAEAKKGCISGQASYQRISIAIGLRLCFAVAHAILFVNSLGLATLVNRAMLNDLIVALFGSNQACPSRS